MYIITKNNAFKELIQIPSEQDLIFFYSPKFHAICPDDLADFYYNSQCYGYVDLIIDENNVVIKMTVNQENLNNFLKIKPKEPEEEKLITFLDLAKAYEEGVQTA